MKHHNNHTRKVKNLLHLFIYSLIQRIITPQIQSLIYKSYQTSNMSICFGTDSSKTLRLGVIHPSFQSANNKTNIEKLTITIKRKLPVIRPLQSLLPLPLLSPYPIITIVAI